MKRTGLGLLAMVGSFLSSTIIAGGSLMAMQGKLDTAALTAQPLSLPTLLVSCLDPVAILLEIAAIILVLMGSHQIEGLHRRLAWIAAFFFAAWTVANIGGFIPLSLMGMQSGSLVLVQAGQIVKAGAAVLQYSVPFLLAFGLTRRWSRVLVWLAFGLTVVGNLAVVALPISSIELERIQVPRQTLYAPRFAVDYTTGVYPALLALGYLGGVLYLVVYAFLAWQVWRGIRAGSTPLGVARGNDVR